MTLQQDKVARSYILEALKKRQRSFTKPLLLICLPVSVVASWALFAYDTERSHAWIVALGSVPAMLMALRLMPYVVLLSRDRWVVDDGYVVLRGTTHGRIDGRELSRWTIFPEDQLPGYYNLSIATKNTGSAILLSEQTYPLDYVKSQMKKRFGEQAAPHNRA
jgi:hypothetical protein